MGKGMYGLKLFGIILGGLGFSQQAHAWTAQCNGCDEQAMIQFASENFQSLKQNGPVYVVDLKNGVVRQYAYFNNVTPEWNPEYDPYEEWFGEIPVESSITSGVQYASSIIRPMGEVVIVNPNRPDLPADADNAMVRTDMDDDVDRYIKTMADQHRLNEFVAWADRFAGGPFFNPKALFVTITLVYQDGSRAIYRYDPETGTYKRMENTSRDGQGNLLPEKKEELVGKTYVFEGSAAGDSYATDDFYDMWERIRSMGVPVIDASQPRGRSYAITCVYDYCTIWVIN